MHKNLIITLATAATAATGALAGPLKRDTAETTTYACNPAHSYPNGAQCVSTNGALSLVTPTASSTTTYACNPAHSYPNGAQCVSTNGALSLVTPTASSTTTYACNPAHSYPNGAQCVSTNGALSLVTPTASSSSKACKATSKASTTAAAVTKTASATTAAQATSKASSSSAKACSKKPTTTAAASSSAEASKSSAAQSAASAVSTASATGGQTKIDGLTWTVQDFTRYCSEDKTGCDYNFKITSSDHKLETACTIIRTNVKDAPTENWTNIPCTTGSNVIISWGYSAQFGADHAFGTLVVVDDKEIGYFGVADVNSKSVTKSNPYGSGQFGNLGPNPVYHV